MSIYINMMGQVGGRWDLASIPGQVGGRWEQVGER